jgi:acyl carrier protein
MRSDDILTILRGELAGMKPALERGLSATLEFRREGGLDSMDLVEFVARIEQRFRIVIPDRDLSALVSLKATEEYLALRLSP